MPRTTKMLKKTVRRILLRSFLIFYDILYHVKKLLVWRPRLSVCDPQLSVHIHEMLCGVYVLKMSRMCGFGANQLSETHFS